MFNSVGILIYSRPYKLILKVDEELGNFYRSLIPKYLNVKKQMHSFHITIIRNETPLNFNFWEKYQNRYINFEYDPYIYNGIVYYWLNIFSPILENIRTELGLSTSSEYSRSPDGLCNFHITLGNIKHLQ